MRKRFLALLHPGRCLVFVAFLLGSLGVSVAFADELIPAPPVDPPSTPRPVEVGKLLILGSTCFNWDDAPLIVTPYRIHLPFRNWVRRLEGPRGTVGSCQFSLPIQVPKGHRLVLYSISADQVINLPPEAELFSHFEVAITTARSLRVQSESRALTEPLRQLDELFAEGMVEGGCGQSLIVSGHTEIRLRGGRGLASGTLGHLSFDYALEACE